MPFIGRITLNPIRVLTLIGAALYRELLLQTTALAPQLPL
jgi:hypothetical protein